MQKFELGMPIPLTAMLHAWPQNNNWACEIQVINIKRSLWVRRITKTGKIN